MNLLCDFSDISTSQTKSVRITENKMASVFDIIENIGGQKNPQSVFQRLKGKIANCDYSKFETDHKPTPVISKEGVFLLINAIPGKQAQKIRLQCAQKLVRVMGGDETLIEEIEENARIAASDSTSTQAFFAERRSTNKSVKLVKQPLTDHNLYVRIYDDIVATQQDKNDVGNGKAKSLILTIDIIKFGITQVLKDRSNGYGGDAGSFAYSIKVADSEIAEHIEKVIVAKCKKIVYEGTREYLQVNLLREKFPFLSSDSQYSDCARYLFSMIVGELHSLYPNTKDNFGTSYSTSLVQSIQGIVTRDEGNLTLATETKALTISDLPEYSILYPNLSNEHNFTHRKICKRLEVEREKTRRQEEKTKQEEERTRRHIKREKEKTRREELRLSCREEKTKQLDLQIQLLKLQNGINIDGNKARQTNTDGTKQVAGQEETGTEGGKKVAGTSAIEKGDTLKASFTCELCLRTFCQIGTRNRHRKTCILYGGHCDKRDKTRFENACRLSIHFDGTLAHTCRFMKEMEKIKAGVLGSSLMKV